MDTVKNGILQWNCRGFYSNISNIFELVNKYDPIIVSLQELILGQRKLSLKGYRSMHSVGRGGAGLLLRNGTPYTEIALRTTLQAVAATVYIGKQYTVCSIYLPPATQILDEELTELIEQLPQPALILGDFNARDPSWGDSMSTPRANQVKKLLDDHDLHVLNNGNYTHYHMQTDTYSCIDLSLVTTDAVTDFSWDVLSPNEEESYDSDHFPIIINRVSGNEYAPEPEKWSLKRAKWDGFQKASAIMTPLGTTTTEERNRYLTEHILKAAKAFIPTVKAMPKKPQAPFWNQECEQAIKNKHNCKNIWRRTRLQNDKFKYNRAVALARKAIANAKRSSWRKFVGSLNSASPCAEVWNRVRKIAGKYKAKHLPVVKDDRGQTQCNPRIVAEIIGDKFASYSNGHAYSENFQRMRHQLEQDEPDFGVAETEYNRSFTMEELKEALRSCQDTSPGPDKVHNAMIRHLHPTALQQILELYNQIWREGTVPESWRSATVIPIKKEGKNGLDPTHYRPISLTSCLCKLMERMVCRRLRWFLDKEGTITPNQFGFRKYHSTSDPMLMLEHDISQAFARKRMILAVSFDIEKAYDTTWKWGILNSMSNMGLRGNLPKFIADFLRDRKFKLRIGDHLSEEKPLVEGLPQGSVLSCDLFKIAINDIVRNIPLDIKHLLYVDDLMIYCEGGNLPTLNRRIQGAISSISRWAEMHGYKLSTTKTQCVLFNRRGERGIPNLTLYNQPIPVKNEIKFLGLIYDNRLTWSSHIKKLKNECRSPLTLLKHLSHLDWGADKKTLTKLYQSLIQSKLNYGCEIFSANAKVTEALNKIQNEALRIISGAFKSSPIKSMQVDCNILPMELQVLQVGVRHLVRMKQEPTSPVNELVTTNLLDNVAWNFTRNARCLLGDNFEEDLKVMTVTNTRPPWAVRPVDVCEGINAETTPGNPVLNATLFRDHISQHDAYTPIFTDGSKNSQGVGSAIVIPTLSLEDSRTLPTDASIFTAESVAIIIGLELVDKLPKGRYIIYSDSLSVLAALRQFEPTNPLIKKIKDWVQFLCASGETRIKFCWSPAHAGIMGNEMADCVAKRAASRVPTQMNLPFSDYLPRIRARIHNKWQSQWDQETQNKLRTIHPSIRRWESSYHKRRRYETILTRLRIGHCNFSHVYLMKKEPQPRCCGVPLTVKHLLVSCHQQRGLRLAMYPSANALTPDELLSEMLAENEKFNIEKLMQYLKRLHIYDKI